MDTAAYYCFVTIATIGFGDVVPSLSSPDDESKLIAVCTYMLFGMATLSMCFTLAQDQMAAKFRMIRQKCGVLLCCKKSSEDQDEREEAEYRERIARPRRSIPVQPLSTAPSVPAGTEVFEMQRRKRVARLKFRWIRQQLSSKSRGRRRSRATLSSSTDDDQRPRSDSVLDDDVAMTTTSGTVVDPAPARTGHVITINGTAHPVRDCLIPGELVQLRQRSATTRSAGGRRRSSVVPQSTYDIQRRPLPNIAEERL